MDLPAALRAAIDRELAGVSRRDLAERTAATTAAYRSGRTSAVAILGREDALAYALARLPATFAATAIVLAEAARMAPTFAPTSLLDAGAGPGGGSWAARETWPSLRSQSADAARPSRPAWRLAAGTPLSNADPARRSRRLAVPAGDGAGQLCAGRIRRHAGPGDEALRQATGGAWPWSSLAHPPATPASRRPRRPHAAGARSRPLPALRRLPAHAPDWCHFVRPRPRDHKPPRAAEVPRGREVAYPLAAPRTWPPRPHAPRAGSTRAGSPASSSSFARTPASSTVSSPRRDKPAHARPSLDWATAFRNAHPKSREIHSSPAHGHAL